MIRRYLQINDPHVSDQPPMMRTASYRDDVLTKLAACMALAEEHEVHGVVITGDLFHRKAANHTSHDTVQRLRVVFDGSIPVWLVPGNHDLARGSGNISGQPLLSVTGGNVQLLLGPHENDPYIFGVAWSNSWEREDGAEQLATYMAKLLDGEPLVFAHAPLTPTPNPFGPEARGWLLTDDLSAALRDRECAPLLIAYGHMHNRIDLHAAPAQYRDARVPGYTLGPVYSNPGALSRGTIADTDQEPMVALITYDTERQIAHVEYLPVPHRPAAEVFRLREAVARSERDENIANLASGLATAETYSVTPESLVQHLEGLERVEGIAPMTWDRGIKYAAAAIEEAGS